MKSSYYIVKSLEEVRQVIQSCKETGYCCFDYETNAQPLYMHTFTPTLLSISFQPGSSVQIPLDHFERDKYTDGFDWREALQMVGREVFQSLKIVKIAWNAKFDDQINKKYNIQCKGTLLDGMLAKYLLNEERPNGLKEMVERYLPAFAGYQKENNLDKMDWDKKPLDLLSKYAGLDVDCTFRLTLFFEKRLIDLGMYNILRNLYMPASRLLTEVEANGLYLDRGFNQQLLAEYEPKIKAARETIYNLPRVQKYNKIYIQTKIQNYLDQLQRELDDLDPDNPKDKRKITLRENKIANIRAGVFTTKAERALTQPINLNSNKDLPALMYSKEGLNLPIIAYTQKDYRDTDKPSTAEDTLVELRLKIKKPDSPKAIFLDKLLELRGLEKMYKTYILGWSEKVQDDSCLHGRFLLTGTTSGRLSSAEPNLQQIPKTSVDPNIKKQLIARPGQLYLVMDFSQCIDGESYIFCDTGIKKLKDIDPNKDRIYLTDPREPYGGQYKVIEGLTYKGNAKCIKIVTNTGRELILTPDHRVKTPSGYTQAGKLQSGDTLLVEKIRPYPKINYIGHRTVNPLKAYQEGLLSYIPSWVMDYDRESLMYFLAGLVDTRGFIIGNNTLVIERIPRESTQEVQLLFQSVGYEGFIKEGVFILVSGEAIRELADYLKSPYKTRALQLQKISSKGNYHEGVPLNKPGFSYELVDHLEEAGYHDVYDLSVQDIHEFNPNGIRVHNCELRIMAHLSKDDTYLKAFKENKDPHLAIAAQKYGVPYEEAEKIYEDENHPDYKLWKTRRKQAKQIAFGLIYGIQSKLLSVKLSDPKAGLIVTPEEAQQMMDDYFKEHPRIKKFMASQEKLLYKQGYIKSLFGNKRRLPGIYSENNADVAYAVRLSLNFPCQSAASHMTLFGAVLNYWDMKRGYFPPMDEICTVHDAVYYNTDPKYINVYTIWKLWDTFRNPKTKQYFNFQIDDVDMSMDFEIGRTMGEELPFIPGYDYNKMLQPDFSVEAYMEEYHKHKGLLIKEFPERFPELFEQGKEWRKLK